MLSFLRRIRFRLLGQAFSHEEKNIYDDSGSARKSSSTLSRYMLYAIGEIGLVVIGILIALQVNNWNENRKMGISEQMLLKSLLVEMQANANQLNVVLDYNTKSRNAAKKMIEIYNGDNINEDHQEIDSILAIIQWAFTFNPEMGTLNSIKNSGEINSIQNDNLKTLISSYEDMSNDALEESNILRDMIINKYVPMVSQYISLNQRLNYLGEDYEVGKSKFEPDYEGLLQDRSLESLIAYIHTWRVDESDELERMKATTEEFISIVESEINN